MAISLNVKIYEENYLLLNKNAIESFHHYNINSPYQYFGWLKCAYEESKYNFFKKVGYKNLFAELYKDNKLIAIAPLVIRRIGKCKGVLFLGYDTASDYLDFLLSTEVTEEDVLFFIKEILRQTKNDTFYFSGLRENSITSNVLLRQTKFEKTGQDICVSVKINFDSYSAYQEKLSKSVRQNIRTATNRLLRDNKKGELKVYHNNITKKLAIELQQLYEKRYAQHNATRRGVRYFFYKIKRKVALLRFNYHTESMINNDDSIVLVYYIDGEVAAFGHALKSVGGILSFMQVAFSEKYKRYSPGMLMFSEFIKKQLEEGKKYEIDLTVGTEKYKYDLGGKNHFIFSGIYYMDEKRLKNAESKT